MKKNQGNAAEMKKEEPEPRTTTRSSRRLTTSENVTTPTKTRKSTATQKKTEPNPPEVAKPSRSTRNSDAAKVQTTTRTPRKSAVAASKKSDVATPKKSTAQKSPPTVVAIKTRRGSAVKATETVEKTTKSRATPNKSKTDDKDEKVKPSQKTGGVTPSRRSARLSDKLPDEETEVVKKTTLQTIAEVPATVSKRRSLLNEFELVSPTKGKKVQEESGSPEKSTSPHVNKLGKRKSPRGAESATEEPESSPPKAKRTAKNKEKDSDGGKSQEVSSSDKTAKNSSPEKKLGKRKSPRSKEPQDDEPSPSKKAAKLKEEKFESMVSPKKKKLEASPDQKKSQGSSPEKATRKSRRQAEAHAEEPELSPTKAKRTAKNKEKDSNDDKKPDDVASPNKAAGTNTVEQNLAKRKSPRSNTQEGDPSPSKRAAKWKEEKNENMGTPKKKKTSISPDKSARKSPRSNSNSKNKNNTEDEKSEELLESSPEKKTGSPKQQDSPKNEEKSSDETKSKSDLTTSPNKTQKSLTSSDSQEEKQAECSPKKTKLDDESKQPGGTEPEVQEQVSSEEAEPKQDTSEEKEKKSLPPKAEHKDNSDKPNSEVLKIKLDTPTKLESSNDVEKSQESKDVESENTRGKMEECQLDTNQEIPENNEEPPSLENKADINQESKTEVSAGEQIVGEEVEKVNNDDIKTSNSVKEVESPSKQDYAEQIIENAQNSALETCTAENKSNADIQERQVEKIKTETELDSNADTDKTVDSTSDDVNRKEMVSNDPLESSYKTEEDKTSDSDKTEVESLDDKTEVKSLDDKTEVKSLDDKTEVKSLDDKTEVKSLDSPKEDEEKPGGTLPQDIPESKATGKTESEELKEEKQDAPVGGSPQTEETCASVVASEQSSNELLAEPVEKLPTNIPESEETNKTDESEESRNENTEFEEKQEAQTDESSEKDFETCTKSKGDECDKTDVIPPAEESIISVEDFMVDSDTDKEEKSKDAAKPENVSYSEEEEAKEQKPVNPLHTEKTPLDIKQNNSTDDRTELEANKVEFYDENEKLEDEVQQIKHDKDVLVNEKNSLDVENSKITEKTTLSGELTNTTVSFCSKTEQNSESFEQDEMKKENSISEPELPLKNANNHTPPMILTNENCNDSDNSCDSGVEVHKSPIDREDQFENFPMKKINVASQAQEGDTESEQNHVTPAQDKDIPQMELEEIETEEKEGDDTILLSTCDESESGDEESAAESDTERKLVKNKFLDIVKKEVLDNGKEDSKKMEMENLEVGDIQREEKDNKDKVINKTMKIEKQEVMDNSSSKKTKLSEEEEENEVTSVKKPKIDQEIKAFDNEDTLDRLKYRISLCNLPKDATENQIRTAFTTVAVHDIIDTYIFVPNAKKNKSARAIVSFRTEKSLHKAISSYGKIEINGTPIYMLFDNALPFNWIKKPDTNENTSNKETANKNPKKRYIAHISKIPIVANANDILNALAERGISSVSRITLHKPTSSSQHYLKGFVKFSKKKSLLKTLRKADRIRVNGNPIKIVPGDEKSYELLKAKRAHALPSTSKENSTVQ